MKTSHPFSLTELPPLDFLPIGLFGSVMGLTGLAIAWHEASARYEVLALGAGVIGVIALVVFAVLLIAYGWKCVTAWSAVKAEFQHPVAGALFGTFWVSLLLLPVIIAPFSQPLALGMWILGAIGMTVFAWFVVNRWMTVRQQLAHATPAWIVPVVGLLDLPLAMPSVGLQAHSAPGIFALAVGLFFTLPLFTLIFARLLFETPLPSALRPSLMILLAPFAVGYSSYLTVTGSHDVFALILYMLTLFVLLVLVGQMRFLAQSCPFRVSWWAVSFPLAASAICAFRVAKNVPGVFTETVAWVLFGVTNLILLMLLLRTLRGVFAGELRRLSS